MDYPNAVIHNAAATHQQHGHKRDDARVREARDAGRNLDVIDAILSGHLCMFECVCELTFAHTKSLPTETPPLPGANERRLHHSSTHNPQTHTN